MSKEKVEMGKGGEYTTTGNIKNILKIRLGNREKMKWNKNKVLKNIGISLMTFFGTIFIWTILAMFYYIVIVK